MHAKVSFLEIAKKGLEMLGRKELQKYIDALGGEADALKKAGVEKLAPVTGDAKKAIDAIKTGDAKSLDDVTKKAQTDAKALQDKDALKKKADEMKKLEELNPFKKKK